jgi:hypothetical protein
MRVFTIQHRSVINKILKQGQYKTDSRFICFEHFSKHYKWMAKQAKKRIKNWSSNRPIWVWTSRPDLRSWKSEAKNLVIIELEIPDEEILLSNFELWHFVLNNSPISSQNLNKAKMMKSWEKCFTTRPQDLKKIEKEIGPISYANQGIIQKILKSQIVSYKFFTARGTKRRLNSFESQNDTTTFALTNIFPNRP